MPETHFSVTDLQPAVFPLSGIELDPPLIVKALKTNGPVKKGSVYLLRQIWPDGRVAVYLNAEQAMAVNPMKMGDFVQMLRVPKPPVNDNGKK